VTALHSPFAVAHRFTPADADQLAAALKVVADPARLRILALLAEHGQLTVAALVPHLGLTQPTVSHHLAILRDAGLVVNRQAGREVIRELDVAAVGRLAELIDPYGGYSGGRR
jgi:ArsR family transcriptional regulator